MIAPVGLSGDDPGSVRRAWMTPWTAPDCGAWCSAPVGSRFPDGVIDALLAGASTEEEIAGPGGLLAERTRRLVERAMEVELTDHLGSEPHAEPPGGTGNTRNGTSPKTLVTEHGQVAIDAPRDRDGSFAPRIVRKRQRRFEGFDERILALYSHGLSTRDIEAHLEEIYGVRVGRDLISKVTDGVMDDARAWAARPLEDVYPVIFLDALVLKIREGGSVARRACYLALGVTLEGDRDVLGLWFQETEGAKFWMQVLVRHEALLNRMEVKDHHRPAVAAAGLKLRAARTGRRRGGRKAALTTTEQVGIARRPGSGKRDRKVYVRNSVLTPLYATTSSKPGGSGLGSGIPRRSLGRLPGRLDRLSQPVGWPRGRTAAYLWMAAGAKLGTDPVDRFCGERGNRPGAPCSSWGGQARRLLAASGRGKAAVLVRVGESPAHGEGRQQVRSGRTGRPGGRR